MSAPAPEGTVFVHEFITGGGLAGVEPPASLVAEGNAMRRALAEDFAQLPGVKVFVSLDKRLPAEEGPWETIRIGPGEHENTFSQLAAEADYTALIAPETGGVLHSLTTMIGRVGGRSIGCTAEAIDLAGDKLRLCGVLSSRRIPTPPTRGIVPSEGLPLQFPYPAVLKPVDGAGAINTYYVETPFTCPEGAKVMPEALLQPYTEGVPMSASFLVGFEGRSALVGVARQWIERVDSRFRYRGGTVPVRAKIPLEPLQRTISSIPGLRGWVGIDFVWDEAMSKINVIDVNPRLTTSYIGLRHLVSPGALAWNWLASIQDPSLYNVRYWAARIKSRPPLTFTADGKIREDGSEP